MSPPDLNSNESGLKCRRNLFNNINIGQNDEFARADSLLDDATDDEEEKEMPTGLSGKDIFPENFASAGFCLAKSLEKDILKRGK